MQISFVPFIISLLLSQRLFSFSKINNHQQWIKLFRYARFFAIFLFAAEIILSASNTTRWIWHILLISLVLFAFQQKEMRSLRMYLSAIAPYVLVSLLRDLTEVLISDFYKRWNNYFDNAVMLAVIWLVAILFSQYRERKATEKERLKRIKEDEINRAIAIRKVELEGLVAERTTELTKQKEELQHTLNELRSTQDQLIHSEKMASLGELTAGIAHEIQNPLNFVNNFSEINTELISELEDERQKEIRDFENEFEILKDIKENEQKINHHGKRADAIVKGMLQHSRTSTGHKEPTDINALADEYLRLSYHGLRAKDKSFNSDFKTEFDESLPKINVIPQDIGRVLLNLINNAFYAVKAPQTQAPPPPEGGIQESDTDYKPLVIVRTSYLPPSEPVPINREGMRGALTGGAVLVSVSDNGPGIHTNIKDKIFQPFFTTKPTGQGTGLGLSLSYDIVKAHGGEIKVESVEGEGTVFTIKIPVN